MYRAFSLIELMVVIAIVAVLAAVAVPVYGQYKLRATIERNYEMIFHLADELKKEFNVLGDWPTDPDTFNWGGYTWTICNSPFTCPVNLGHRVLFTDDYNDIYLVQLDYFPTTKAFRIYAYLEGLSGIDGYIEPSVSENNGKSLISLTMQEENGVIVTRCGIASPGSLYFVPIEYHPAGCSCEYLGNIVNGNTPVCD